MRLPSVLHMGYFKFPVRLANQAQMQKMTPPPGAEGTTLGLFNPKEGIHILKGLPSYDAAHAFLHETLHAACCYRETWKHSEANRYQEYFVTEIANSLATAMKQNPKVFNDILKALR